MKKVNFKTEIVTGEWMICPHCETRQSVIGHGEKRTCGCGLLMESWGNALYVSMVLVDNEIKILN